jgi:predicted  nucleic acid-binding Zn ribbon protein
MFVAEIQFDGKALADEATASSAIHSLLGALRMNGQVLNREWPVFLQCDSFKAIVLVAERDSLDELYFNKYVRASCQELTDAGLSFRVTILGADIEGTETCHCSQPTSYVLFTTGLSLESPLRCGDCFSPVPLYRVPHSDGEDEFYGFVCWQSDYQSCDRLQMNCRTLEAEATREISDVKSELSNAGIEICEKVGQRTGKPIYYYLYRDGNETLEAELMRRCPGCDGEWRLTEAWHRRFDFRCERCHLLSNIAWSVRP